MVMMGFQGSHYSQFADCAATEVLWRYLAESAVSPMEKELVQTAVRGWRFTDNEREDREQEIPKMDGVGRVSSIAS